MLTIRRAALLGLLVLGVSVMAGCTVNGDAARARRDEAQKAMAMEHGFTPGEAAPAKAAAARTQAVMARRERMLDIKQSLPIPTLRPALDLVETCYEPTPGASANPARAPCPG